MYISDMWLNYIFTFIPALYTTIVCALLYMICVFTISLMWLGSSAVAHAGERLCSTEDCIPSTGTYLRHGYIFASLAGYVLRKNEGEEVSSCITVTFMDIL